MQELKAGLVFDKMVQSANKWIIDAMYELSLTEPDQAYHVMKATLQALRDRLPTNEVVHMGAQLPTIIRGIYYENWKITDTPVKLKTREEFFHHTKEIHHAPLPVAAEDAARAVFKILYHHVSEGESEKIKPILPEQLRDLWPQKA